MDEIQLFTELQPPPPLDAPRIREAARARLGVAMSVPVSIRRPRVRRVAMAGALAVGAAVALAITALLSGNAGPGASPRAHLTAWTVVKQSNGSIAITLSWLQDPAGLQRALRADGVPVSVYLADESDPQWKPPCTPYSRWWTRALGPGALDGGLARPTSFLLQSDPPLGNTLTLNPSRIPSGLVLVLILLRYPVQTWSSGPDMGVLLLHNSVSVGFYFAQPSQQCTGS